MVIEHEHAARPVPRPDELSPTIDYAYLIHPSLLGPHPVKALHGATSYFGCIYATVTGWRSLRLDLHVPIGAGPFPLVVYVHGGSFLGGLPTMGPWRELLAHGIAVASVDYRLAAEASFPAPVEDVRSAVRWVRANASTYQLDCTRVALWGSSAGGYLALMAGLAGDQDFGRRVGDMQDVSAEVSAIVDHYGIADPTRLGADAEFVDSKESARLDGLMRLFLGGDPRADPALGARTDPISLISSRRTVPPILLAHGDADSRVGIAQSRRLHAQLVGAGVQVEFDIHPGAEHGDPSFESQKASQRVIGFLTAAWAPPQSDKS